MPKVTKNIKPATIKARVDNALSRAGDEAAASSARQRAKRDALAATASTPAHKAKMRAADERGKARTFTNNVAAQGVVKKAEDKRKAALFDRQYAAQRRVASKPKAPTQANAKQLRRSAGTTARAARRAKR